MPGAPPATHYSVWERLGVGAILIYTHYCTDGVSIHPLPFLPLFLLFLSSFQARTRLPSTLQLRSVHYCLNRPIRPGIIDPTQTCHSPSVQIYLLQVPRALHKLGTEESNRRHTGSRWGATYAAGSLDSEIVCICSSWVRYGSLIA